jgi:hypothetical protein
MRMDFDIYVCLVFKYNTMCVDVFISQLWFCTSDIYVTSCGYLFFV